MRFQRELTAAVLIPAVLAVLVAAPPWAWALLVALAATMALLEFFRLIEAAGWIVPKPAGVGLFLAIVAAAHLASLLALVVLTGVTLLALPTLVMFASPREAVLLASSASSVFATLYVALGAGAMIGLRAIGWQPVVFLLAIVWAGDSAAYYAGRRWGKRKLAPVVSPKKTWEGLWGQLGAGLAFGAAAAFLLGGRQFECGAQIQVAADVGTGVLAHEPVEAPRQRAFARSRVQLDQQLGDRQAENTVAEEFQALVVVDGFLVGARAGVGQRTVQQRPALEMVAQRRFESFQIAAARHAVSLVIMCALVLPQPSQRRDPKAVPNSLQASFEDVWKTTDASRPSGMPVSGTHLQAASIAGYLVRAKKSCGGMC